ncbi:MAG: ABC transporter substrate-binding protein [Acidimicrobiales bacterium]
MLITSDEHRKRSIFLIAVVLTAFSLLVTACGGGRSSTSDNGTETSKATSSTDFGTMATPCGTGDAEGATQQGVTDTSITIGYGDDAGYTASPGLNKEMSDAIKAMMKWCNDQGGINGRQIVGKYYDAAITNVNNVTLEACSQVFMLVGQGWAFDSAQEATRVGCQLASVPTYSVSPQFSNGPMMVQPSPNPADFANVSAAAQIAEKFPTKVKKAVTMYGDYSATIDLAEKAVAAYSQVGWEFLDCSQKYNIGGEAVWAPMLQRLKDCGAEVVYFSGSPAPHFENVLDAAKAIGFSPIWMQESNFYDTAFANWNKNGNADNVYVQLTYYPFDQAERVPATAKYLEIVKANGGSTSLSGAQATAAFLLWAQGAKTCGSTLTSQCVIDNLKKVNNYDAGGLQSPTDPGGNKPGDCSMVVKLSGTKFEQVLPTAIGTQACNPKYLVRLTGPIVDRAKLDANRISQTGG